jgi:hypothetical protein
VVIFTGIRAPTASDGVGSVLLLVGLSPVTGAELNSIAPILDGVGVATASADLRVNPSPVLLKVKIGSESSRSYVTAPFTFKIYPAPEMTHIAGVGGDSPELIPISFVNVGIAATISSNDVPVSLVGSAPAPIDIPYLPKRDYLFGFDVEPQTIRIPYIFDFDILKKAASATFDFNIVQVVKTVQSYNQWFFSILLTADKPYVSFNFAFSIQQPRTYADFYFEVVGEPITYYDFTFNVAREWKDTFDFECDVVETWVPVTLVCAADATRPGTVTPSSRKHRLSIRVYVGAILVGAGYAYYTWDGPDNAQIKFYISGIPQLSSEHRIVIFDDTKKVYDSVLPYSEFWSDTYGTA